MTIQTMRNGTMCELPDNGEHPEQTKTFDDIPKYALVILRGNRGYVIDKGDHLSDRDGRYLLISYESGTAHGDQTQLHEKVVNKYLHEKRNLFVDFTEDLIGNHDVSTESVQAVPET